MRDIETEREGDGRDRGGERDGARREESEREGEGRESITFHKSTNVLCNDSLVISRPSLKGSHLFVNYRLSVYPHTLLSRHSKSLLGTSMTSKYEEHLGFTLHIDDYEQNILKKSVV